MPRNAFKIDIIDEDAEEEASTSSSTAVEPITEKKTVIKKSENKIKTKTAVKTSKLKRLPKRSDKTAKIDNVDKQPAPSKPVLKSAVKKSAETKVSPNVKDKTFEKKEEDVTDLIAEKASLLKKVILENTKTGENKSAVLKEIENNEKKTSLKDDLRPVSPFDPTRNISKVKDLVDTELKVKQSPADKINENKIINKIRTKKSIKLYKKIAFSFIFLTLALLAVVFYFTLVKATITLVPNQERVSNNMIVDINDKNKSTTASDNNLKGIVTSLKMEQKGTYVASGTEVTGEEVSGTVKIINNYIKNQPLVATTRLFPPNGNTLYRLKDTVNVPAGGSVEAEIYADQATPDAATSAETKFTFPGLWAGIQDKIYAVSEGPIEYKQKFKRTITQPDIDSALADLRQKILDQVKTQTAENYKDYNQILYKIDESSVISDINGKAGEEKDSFDASLSTNVVITAFSGQEMAGLAKQKFISSLASNKELVTFNENNIVYSLNDFNTAEGIATINVTFEGQVSLKQNSNIIDVDKILGLNDAQLRTYLSALPDIAGYDIVYYPSFWKKVPKLVDRINIVIKR